MSERLIEASLFVPPGAQTDSEAMRRLASTVRDADRAGFRIKVALVAKASDLGPVSDLYREPQKLAEFLGLDLSAVFRGGVLVVMRNGYGYVLDGAREERSSRVLADLPDPGRDQTKQAEAAIAAVRRLATAAGHTIVLTKGGVSESRDRITIAAEHHRPAGVRDRRPEPRDRLVLPSLEHLDLRGDLVAWPDRRLEAPVHMQEDAARSG